MGITRDIFLPRFPFRDLLIINGVNRRISASADLKGGFYFQALGDWIAPVRKFAMLYLYHLQVLYPWKLFFFEEFDTAKPASESPPNGRPRFIALAALTAFKGIIPPMLTSFRFDGSWQFIMAAYNVQKL